MSLCIHLNLVVSKISMWFAIISEPEGAEISYIADLQDERASSLDQ